MVLKSDRGHGYVRVDWFTPNGLPTWGDGRLFIQGTEGFIELRKYTEIGRPHVTNTLYLVNGEENAMIDAGSAGLPYFPRLVADVEERTETSVGQAPYLHGDGTRDPGADEGGGAMTCRVSIVGAGIGVSASRGVLAAQGPLHGRKCLRPERDAGAGAGRAVRGRGRDGGPCRRHRGPRHRHRGHLPAAAPAFPRLHRCAGGGQARDLREAAGDLAQGGRRAGREGHGDGAEHLPGLPVPLWPRDRAASRSHRGGACGAMPCREPRDALGPGRGLLRDRLARDMGGGVGRGASGPCDPYPRHADLDPRSRGAGLCRSCHAGERHRGRGLRGAVDPDGGGGASDLLGHARARPATPAGCG
jgi:hypothetical protein